MSTCPSHLRVLRVTSDCQVHLGRVGWQDFQVPWDQLDLQDLLGHQGHRTAFMWVEVKRIYRCFFSCVDRLEKGLYHYISNREKRSTPLSLQGNEGEYETNNGLPGHSGPPGPQVPNHPYVYMKPSLNSRCSASCFHLFCLPGSTWYCRSSCKYCRVCMAFILSQLHSNIAVVIIINGGIFLVLKVPYCRK